ncbi:hypothetical protein DPMN_131971 [Dreissena polymorpha]|uniref:Uncharacterized protein n=1 Tax=Dreissena polymorpha TaxID=45954 RepID=A0A9D4JBN2_DREPO|nr:hypothetical protein DPMN_131971 [Dreissena polymorpha]
MHEAQFFLQNKAQMKKAFTKLYQNSVPLLSDKAHNKMRDNLLHGVVTQSECCRGDQQLPHGHQPSVLVGAAN